MRKKRDDIVWSQERRDSARIDPISLDGWRVLSLDAPGLHLQPVERDLVRPRIDWERALREINLTSDEIEAFQVLYLAEFENSEALKLLGWRPARFAAVSVSLRNKMDRILVALRPVIDAQIQRAVPTLDPMFAEIVQKERVQPKPANLPPDIRRTFRMVAIAPEEKLELGRSRLQELIATQDDCERLVKQLAAANSAAQKAAQAETEQAFIDERKADDAIIRGAAVASKKLDEANAKLTTAQGATARQRSQVNALADEINAARWQKIVVLVQPKAARLANLQDEMATLALEIASATAGTSHTLFPGDLFPNDSQTMANLRAGALTSVLQILQYQRLFSGKAA